MKGRILKITLVGILLVFGLAYVYYLVFLTTVRVPTGSMANTIIPGDLLLVKKRAFGDIKRSDLIVFKYPRDSSVLYVARVVGLPGELIEVRGRIVYINDKELPEQRVTVKPDSFLVGFLEEISSEGSGSYRVFYGSREGYDSTVPSDEEANEFGIGSPFRVPADNYFVMGDNRDNSSDSRFWGTVQQGLIFGKPTMIYWSSKFDETGSEEPKWERVFTKLR